MLGKKLEFGVNVGELHGLVSLLQGTFVIGAVEFGTVMIQKSAGAVAFELGSIRMFLRCS